MVCTRFYKPIKPKQRGQQSKQHARGPRVKLSKEALQLLKVRWRKAQLTYQQDIDKAWDLIDEWCASIAETHSKSFQHVQYALHMGRRQLT